jgi:hypothetical protein
LGEGTDQSLEEPFVSDGTDVRGERFEVIKNKEDLGFCEEKGAEPSYPVIVSSEKSRTGGVEDVDHGLEKVSDTRGGSVRSPDRKWPVDDGVELSSGSAISKGSEHMVKEGSLAFADGGMDADDRGGIVSGDSFVEPGAKLDSAVVAGAEGRCEVGHVDNGLARAGGLLSRRDLGDGGRRGRCPGERKAAGPRIRRLGITWEGHGEGQLPAG